MLEELFYSKTIAKIIEHFISIEKNDTNQRDIARDLGIHELTVRKALKKLIKYEIIIITKKMGKSVFYTLNSDSEVVSLLKGLRADLGVMKIYKENDE